MSENETAVEAEEKTYRVKVTGTVYAEATIYASSEEEAELEVADLTADDVQVLRMEDFTVEEITEETW